LQYEEGSSGNYLVFAGRPQVIPGVDVTFGFAAQTVTEATTTFNVDVYLSEPAPVPVIVTLQTGGTAGAGDCYLLDPSSRTLVFPPGEVARQVRLQLLNDALWEGQETFTLQFANYIGAVAGTFTNFTLRINDSLPAPTAAFGNFSTSFQEAITSPSVPVQLSAPSAIPVRVSVITRSTPASFTSKRAKRRRTSPSPASTMHWMNSTKRSRLPSRPGHSSRPMATPASAWRA
jgi:hypothetical protein